MEEMKFQSNWKIESRLSFHVERMKSFQTRDELFSDQLKLF